MGILVLNRVREFKNYCMLLIISILLKFATPQARSSGNYVEYINKKKWQLKSDCKDSERKVSLFST